MVVSSHLLGSVGKVLQLRSMDVKQANSTCANSARHQGV